MPMTPKDTKPSQYLLRRSHRTASRRYFRWNQAKSRSILYRSIGASAGLPRRAFPFGPVRFGMRGLIPRLRIFFSQLLGFVSFVELQHLGSFSRPTYLSGRDIHLIQKRFNLFPFALLGPGGDNRERIALPIGQCVQGDSLSLASVFDTFASAFPGSKGSIDRRSFPDNQAGKFCSTKKATLDALPGSISLPNAQPPMSCRSGPPDRAIRDVSPPAACNQNVEDCVQDLTSRRGRLPLPALFRFGRHESVEKIKLFNGQSFKTTWHGLQSPPCPTNTANSPRVQPHYWDRFMIQ